MNQVHAERIFISIDNARLNHGCHLDTHPTEKTIKKQTTFIPRRLTMMPPPRPDTVPSHQKTIAGRIVRLHFSCRVELPMGSTLRVSTKLDAPDVQSMYANSVEMITSNELYPIFRTKSPVIIILNHPSRKSVQHHYYRYMVVSPAVDTSREESTNIVQTEYGYPGVLKFETPFPMELHPISASAVSLGSLETHNSAHYLAMLPYRMVDIRVDSASVVERMEDIWENPDDVSFQPFRIRDAVRIIYVS